jgi:hypothetical protein
LAQSILQMVEFLAPLTQIDQGVLDYLDVDGMAKHIIRVTGTPATVVRGEGEVAQLREQRAAQAAQQAELQTMQSLATSAGEAAPALRAVEDSPTLQGMA